MKILLWRIGALGDVVMTTPLVRQLRAAVPSAQIDYLVGGRARVIVQGSPHLSSIKTFDEEVLYRGRVHRLRPIIEQLRDYDVVLTLDKHWIFPLLAKCAGVPMRVGFARRPIDGAALTHSIAYGGVRHEVAYYLDLLRPLHLPVDAEDTALELPEPSPLVLDGPYVVLVNSGGANAFESSDVRKLPTPLFAALAASCSRQGRIVFVGSAQERAQYDGLRIHDALNLCGELRLDQVWSVLQRAGAIFTTDCGLMHMAAAVNPRVTAIFGPTHPMRKCPPKSQFVWCDEALYDNGYELFGRVPAARYFSTMSVEQILEGATPMPANLGSQPLVDNTPS